METEMKTTLMIAAVALVSLAGTNNAKAAYHHRHHHASRYEHYSARHSTWLTVPGDIEVVIVHGQYLGRDPDINIRLAMIRQGFFGDQ
jgi:hypothetical protein